MINKFLISLNLVHLTVEILFDYMKAESFRKYCINATMTPSDLLLFDSTKPQEISPLHSAPLPYGRDDVLRASLYSVL